MGLTNIKAPAPNAMHAATVVCEIGEESSPTVAPTGSDRAASNVQRPACQACARGIAEGGAVGSDGRTARH